jgi:light-regulated signal transduction histidine kinase (bacteriophytochrome)
MKRHIASASSKTVNVSGPPIREKPDCGIIFVHKCRSLVASRISDRFLERHTMSMPVTLENCDREPIHIPGLIQPHGALLAFDREGNLVFSSSNAAELLGLVAPRSGPLEALGLEPTVVSLIQSWRVDSAKNFACFGVAVNGRNLDIIGNRNDNDLLIVEFEMVDQTRTADESSFPTLVHRAMERFKRQTDINELLGMVATEVRKITGFDRVMAYRFRHDDSGEVVRESRRDDLDSWEGHRYHQAIFLPRHGAYTL